MAGALKLLALVLWVLIWMPPVAIVRALKKKKMRGRLVMCATRGMLAILNVHVRLSGEVSATRPLLIASNHLSYLDILVIASAIDTRFVPKREVASWPFISWICTLLDVVYVDRRAGKIHEGTQALREALAQGEIVTLFPEATTGDGRHLLAFKSAFFESAQGVMIQAVAVAYRKIGGLPIDFNQWPLIAWYGDMSLMPHLWQLCALGRIEVELHFLAPFIYEEGMDRKTIAIQAHNQIREALAAPALGKD